MYRSIRFYDPVLPGTSSRSRSGPRRTRRWRRASCLEGLWRPDPGSGCRRRSPKFPRSCREPLQRLRCEGFWTVDFHSVLSQPRPPKPTAFCSRKTITEHIIFFTFNLLELKNSNWISINGNWAVVEAQLLEQLHPTPEIRGLNPNIGKI